MPDPASQAIRTQAILKIAEEDQRRRILEEVPILHADAQAIAAVLRESVELERWKRALLKFSFDLYPDKGAFMGKTTVEGRTLRLSAREITNSEGAKVLRVWLELD
jgi:hypothetical protein